MTSGTSVIVDSSGQSATHSCLLLSLPFSLSLCLSLFPSLARSLLLSIPLLHNLLESKGGPLYYELNQKLFNRCKNIDLMVNEAARPKCIFLQIENK